MIRIVILKCVTLTNEKPVCEAFYNSNDAYTFLTKHPDIGKDITYAGFAQLMSYEFLYWGYYKIYYYK